ncbi:MAG: 5'/3'-nucleotidase SurE [Candidatus Cloacimonetes bacterium]|nr:5'/3'-nucleotidase SurE [Candidatus Cloacimonadota bacterium]
MRILLTNDDGIGAPGIRALQDALLQAGHEIIMIAPDRERSAASHSLTLRRDLRANRLAENEYSIDGTPVDCVVVAFQHIIKEPVDLVISGINAGQNMGEDVFYSGTVAAALESALHGHKAIAISINSYHDQLFESAASWMVRLMENGIIDQCLPNGVLNINVPNLPASQIRGLRVTRTGHRRYYNFIQILSEDANGFSYRIAGDHPSWEKMDNSDAQAVQDGFISITPLGFELTDPNSFGSIQQWIDTQNLSTIQETAHAF